MEGNLAFLFAAVLTTWVVLSLYLFFLSGRLASLRRQLDSLKRHQDDTDKQAPGRDLG